jgi:hypothetical protein
MFNGGTHDYAMERRLRELNPDLHKRFTDAVFALQFNLSNYKLIFPEFTDHTNLHSLSVIDFCNRLIGDQILCLNADEIYALLMGCYLHDTGMGISMKDFQLFSQQIDFGDYFETHSRENYPAIIRDFHHEYSGRFIQKYQEMLEFPSDAHRWAIEQIARGHRKTDLLDAREYPMAFPLPGRNTLCLPYLAALIRLADEIDVSAARNPMLLYDIKELTIPKEIRWHRMTMAIRALEMTEKAFILTVDASDSEILQGVRGIAEKMRQTLDYCRAAVNGRTPFDITQERVLIREEQ